MLRSLWRKTIGDLRANWRQFLAVWLVVTLGSAFYGAFYPAGLSMLTSNAAMYDQLSFMDYQVKLDSAPTTVIHSIRALPGVAAAEGRLIVESGIQIDPAHEYLVELRLISVPDDTPPSVNRSDIFAGQDIQKKDEILLLKRFADRYGIKPGDSLDIWLNNEKQTFRVAGLVFNPEYMVAGRSREMPFPATSSFGVAWMRYSKLAAIAGMHGQINDIILRLDTPATAAPTITGRQSEAVVAALEQKLDVYENVVILARTQTASGGIINANVNGNVPAVAAFSGLFLTGAVLITSILLGRQVESERQRIGTLRALGITRRELVIHYLAFGLLIGLAGSLAGSLAGYGLSFLVIKTFIDALAGGYLPGFANLPNIPFIAFGISVVTVGATLAGAYPAWVASGTPPGIALRPPTPKTPSALSRLPLGILPLALRQTLRNLLRVPGRSLGTALGVMTGAIMVFSALVIINTSDSSFDDYFDSGQYDLRILMNVFKPARTIESDIQKIDGVAAVQGALLGNVIVRVAGHKDFSTILVALDENRPFLALKSLDGQPAFSSPDGVWIGHNMQRVLGIKIGDTIELKMQDEEKQVRVLGVVSQVFGNPVYIPKTLMTKWQPMNMFLGNAALVRVAPGRSGDVRDALSKMEGVVAIEDYPAFVHDLREYVMYWRQTMLLFGIFGCLLTLAVILNTVSASLQEQQSELSILRSLGVSQSEIILLVTLEMLLMAAVGIAIGVPLGREVGVQLAHNFDMDFYGLMPYVQPASYWIGSGSLLLIVLCAEIPGLRSVFNAALGRLSKSQSM